jgi:hypothetical protein
LEVAGDIKTTGVVQIRRAADGCNAGILNIWDTTNDRGWHITNRRGCDNSLNDLRFFFFDGSTWHYRVVFKHDGNVGIGTHTPQYKLDVGGTIRGKNLTPSDQRLKQNIHPLDNALTKLQGLRGVSFEWKNIQDQEAGTQIGLIAQEVEGVLPELVSTDGDGYKSIAYGQLTAVLIEAVKEQQQIIEQKSATIAELQERMASVEAMMQEMVRQVAALKRETVAQPVQTLHRVSP